MRAPQGGYVAKQCPARAQWDTIRPCEPLPDSPFLQRLFTRGRDFESEVVAQLLELHPDALVVTERTAQNGAEREQETFQALQDGVPLILGGRLPADPAGRRVGEPDLLVAAAGGRLPGRRRQATTSASASTGYPRAAPHSTRLAWESGGHARRRPASGRMTSSSSPTTSGCWRRPGWPPRALASPRSSAPRRS